MIDIKNRSNNSYGQIVDQLHDLFFGDEGRSGIFSTINCASERDIWGFEDFHKRICRDVIRRELRDIDNY